MLLTWCVELEAQLSADEKDHGTALSLHLTVRHFLPTGNHLVPSKLIAVIGATGAQGGGLARAILADPSDEFSVRAVTRKTTSDPALTLARAGAEVIHADLNDVDSLVTAFSSAHGVFAMTNFWEHFSAETESQQATNIAEAAKRAGVAHVVWSTLEDTRRFMSLDDPRMPTLQGKYKVPHLDAKGEADVEFTKRGVPTTNLLTSFYWDNFIHFGMGPARGQDGVLAITLPMGDRPLPGIAAEDIGRAAHAIFSAGDTYIGKTVGIAGDHLTGHEMSLAFSRTLGVPVHYNAISADIYRTFPFPGADDLGNMFQFFHDFNDAFSAARPLAASQALVPGMQTFQQWLGANAARIPLA